MKILKLSIIATLLSFSSQAQDSTLVDALDFWVGEWELTWEQADGAIGKGSNHIVKTLDNKVIQENFEAFEGNYKGFKGTSISVFSPITKSWHQAWADNQGSYFNFIGEMVDGNPSFKTTPVTKDGKVFIQRMVFYDIEKDSFRWDWESTNDGGKTWKLNWRINYQRKQEQ